MSGSNSRIVASRCARLACCCPSSRSSWLTIPASSARLLLNALMTCGSPITDFSWNTIDQDSIRHGLHGKYTGGGGCYIMAEINRLRRENRQLKVERDILSKAAAWFARETDVIPPKGSDS